MNGEWESSGEWSHISESLASWVLTEPPISQQGIGTLQEKTVSHSRHMSAKGIDLNEGEGQSFYQCK